ncbi:MAG: UDP-3-O-acyl-N-acetylglucosamine deacetylase, partial [Gemmatimonadota bacterium]
MSTAPDASGRPRRQTIAREASLEGIGLHLGLPCRVTFRPAPSGTGILFVRTDLEGTPAVRADISIAVESERRTQLGEGESALHTVEHVLAAVAAHQIDDLIIGIDGPEPPIMDGSAGPFFRALAAAGIAPQGGRVEVLTLAAPVRVDHGESWYEAFPADALSLDVTIDFPHPLIGRQVGRYVVTPESFARELADARTFGFAHEVEYLRSRGLIKGGSTENAVVLGESGVVDNALRWPDEFVRHKAMDCVGDLALAGRRVRARVVAHRPSHAGTVRLVREMTRMACK